MRKLWPQHRPSLNYVAIRIGRIPWTIRHLFCPCAKEIAYASSHWRVTSSYKQRRSSALYHEILPYRRSWEIEMAPSKVRKSAIEWEGQSRSHWRGWAGPPQANALRCRLWECSLARRIVGCGDPIDRRDREEEEAERAVDPASIAAAPLRGMGAGIVVGVLAPLRPSQPN